MARISAGLLVLAAIAWPAGEAAAKAPADAVVYAHLGEVASLDPAGPYDAVSQATILNLYDTLIAFKGASLTEFEPGLAVEVPSKANDGVSSDGLIYRFKIRKGVRFHDGSELTPEDARYSLLRFMLADRAGGPSSLLLEPILGVTGTRAKDGTLQVSYEEAAAAVRVDGDDVVVTLKRPFAPFLSIMARWSYVASKKAVIAAGGWDGTAETWKRFNDQKLADMALDSKDAGAGPFMLERWDRQAQLVVLVRHEGYWRGPAAVKRVVMRSVPEFSTRRLMVQADDADVIDVPRPFASQLDGLSGVKVLDDLPRLMTDPTLFFTLKVNPEGNPDIGTGKLDGDGIPPDFFSDEDVRQGFAYAFDYDAYLRDTLKGHAVRAVGPIPPSLVAPGEGVGFQRDVEKAKQHFRKAWKGQVWEKGFTFTLSYNTGSDIREAACQILKKTVEDLNPRFHVNLRPVDWPAFLDKTQRRLMPMWARGWIADYPDPHDFVFPFFHSQGRYAIAQGLSDPELDKLIEKAVGELDRKKRASEYRRLQKLGAGRAYQIFTVHPSAVMAINEGLRGYQDNPACMGPYFYPLSKAQP